MAAHTLPAGSRVVFTRRAGLSAPRRDAEVRGSSARRGGPSSRWGRAQPALRCRAALRQAAASLDEAMGGILLRAVGRALAKYLAPRSPRTRREGAGFLVNLLGAALEGADTRSWRSLPYEIQTGELRGRAGRLPGRLTLRGARGRVLAEEVFPDIGVPEGGSPSSGTGRGSSRRPVVPIAEPRGPGPAFSRAPRPRAHVIPVHPPAALAVGDAAESEAGASSGLEARSSASTLSQALTSSLSGSSTSADSARSEARSRE